MNDTDVIRTVNKLLFLSLSMLSTSFALALFALMMAFLILFAF